MTFGGSNQIKNIFKSEENKNPTTQTNDPNTANSGGNGFFDKISKQTQNENKTNPSSKINETSNPSFLMKNENNSVTGVQNDFFSKADNKSITSNTSNFPFTMNKKQEENKKDPIEINSNPSKPTDTSKPDSMNVFKTNMQTSLTSKNDNKVKPGFTNNNFFNTKPNTMTQTQNENKNFSNTTNIVNKPTRESIKYQNFLDKHVSEVHTNWKDSTDKIKNDIKKLGVYINQNEYDLRSSIKTVENLKESENELLNKYKMFDDNLNKILSNQNNITIQFDNMENELERLFDNSDFHYLDNGGNDNLFSKTDLVSSKLNSYDYQMKNLSEHLNDYPSKNVLDTQFNQTLNNYYESLSVIEKKMYFIEEKISSSFGTNQFI